MNKCKNIDCKNEVAGTKQYCSLSCRSYYNNKYVRGKQWYKLREDAKRDELRDAYNLNPKTCANCNTVIRFESRNRTFCTDTCRAVFCNRKRGPRSESTKQKIRSAMHMMNIIKQQNKQVYNHICEFCTKEFQSTKKRCRKTCSDDCYRGLISQKSRQNPNCGGETNYRRYVYKSISMDSLWEVKFAKFLDDNNIDWIRSKTIKFDWVDLYGTKRRYHPDFYLKDFDIYIDTKNSYLMEQDKFKIEYVKKHHTINLIVGDLDFCKREVLKYSTSL